MKSFVFCHDQRLADKSKLNNSLPNLQWVMLGNNKFTSGIIARKLKANIENHPYLVAYTGLFALVHNGYIEPDEQYAMLEYDVSVPNTFASVVNQHIAPQQIIGFIPYTIDHILFLGGTPLLYNSIMETYGIDCTKVVYDELAKGRRLWCATSNCVIKGSYIHDFVEWFDRLIPSFKRNPQAGHVPERSLRIFMALNNIEPLCISGLLKHEQRKSHGIEAAL